MPYRNKIDETRLKQMLVEGKFTDEIAKEFGVVAGAVQAKIKKLGLTQNYRRPRGKALIKKEAVKTSAPRSLRPLQQAQRPERAERLVPEPVEGQIIPVTLRLNVEVLVRVSTQGI